jgi:hypothetical protein
VQPSPAHRKLLFPETVVICPGKYRVHHSTGHRPDTETFLSRGLILPCCGEHGCTVSFELMFETKDQSELMRFKAAS